MNWRKHIIIVVGGGLAILLFLVALVFMLRARATYARAGEELEASMRRLEMLTRRDPYPSEENIRRVSANLDSLRDKAQQVHRVLTSGQIQPDNIEAAEFAPLLERTVNRIAQRANEAGVVIPDRLTLGMARYLEGTIPSQESIPRLVVQVKTLEALCNLLIQARVSSILSIDRQAFEIASAAPAEVTEPVRRRRSVAEAAQAQPATVEIPLPPESPLYEVERVRVSIACRDAAMWDVLNTLAKSPLIAAVVDVRLSNTIADQIGKAKPVSPITGEPGAPATFVRYPTHDERVIAGREPIQADLVIDVYRFVKDLKEDSP